MQQYIGVNGEPIEDTEESSDVTSSWKAMDRTAQSKPNANQYCFENICYQSKVWEQKCLTSTKTFSNQCCYFIYLFELCIHQRILKTYLIDKCRLGEQKSFLGNRLTSPEHLKSNVYDYCNAFDAFRRSVGKDL